jgi:hypothetical protein
MVAAEARSRRAALALHALADGDRERVLAMLDEEQRRRLEPVLHELRDLGIPPGVSSAEAVPQPRATEPPIKERVAALSAEQVAPALAALSPSTAAALLQVADWQWAEAALDALQGPQRVGVRSQRERMPRPAPRMGEALCRAFDAAVHGRTAEPNPSPQAGRPRWSRWWPWKR